MVWAPGCATVVLIGICIGSFCGPRNSRQSLGSLLGRRSGEGTVLCWHGHVPLVHFAYNFLLWACSLYIGFPGCANTGMSLGFPGCAYTGCCQVSPGVPLPERSLRFPRVRLYRRVIPISSR